MGGLDITMGRWDQTTHPLLDPDRKIVPGLDFYITEKGYGPVSTSPPSLPGAAAFDATDWKLK